MMDQGLEIPFDRLTYRDGQLLAARDAGDDVQRDARLRWLHTRALHNTWGIAAGLRVRTGSDGSSVLVSPGFALDDAGRELVLAQGVTVPVPHVSVKALMVLTVRYQGNAAYRERAASAGACLGTDGNLRAEEPVFSWRRPDEAPFGPLVPLASAVVTGGLVKDLDLRVRCYAQPLRQPYIATGTTEPGSSGWRHWRKGDVELGLELKVDTSGAGFIEEPRYFPVLHGDLRLGVQDFDQEKLEGAEASFSPTAFQSVAEPQRESFVFRITALGKLVPPYEAESRRWHVAWTGIEPPRGCEPQARGYRSLGDLVLDLRPVGSQLRLT
jgi:hypothetical protein